MILRSRVLRVVCLLIKDIGRRLPLDLLYHAAMLLFLQYGHSKPNTKYGCCPRCWWGGCICFVVAIAAGWLLCVPVDSFSCCRHVSLFVSECFAVVFYSFLLLFVSLFSLCFRCVAKTKALVCWRLESPFFPAC